MKYIANKLICGLFLRIGGTGTYGSSSIGSNPKEGSEATLVAKRRRVSSDVQHLIKTLNIWYIYDNGIKLGFVI